MEPEEDLQEKDNDKSEDIPTRSPSRSLWLARKADLVAHFSDPAKRQTVINTWNRELVPQISTYFSNGEEFVGHFEHQVGDRLKLLALMKAQRLVPPFGVPVLAELYNEAKRLLGEPLGPGTQTYFSF